MSAYDDVRCPIKMSDIQAMKEKIQVGDRYVFYRTSQEINQWGVKIRTVGRVIEKYTHHFLVEWYGRGRKPMNASITYVEAIVSRRGESA